MVQLRSHRFLGAAGRALRLAPGILLRVDSAPQQPMLLVSRAGSVHLNRPAVVILELCDGMRNRDRVVVDAMLRCPAALRAADVLAFLAAAQSRGWIIEGE